MPADSGPQKVYWSCTRKHRYPNRRAAQTATIRLMDRTGLMNVYECPYCAGWHIGHSKETTSASAADAR